MNRRVFLRLAAFAVLAAAAAGCCRCNYNQRRYGRPLHETLWQLIQLEGEEVAARDDAFTLTLSADGSIGGRGACNALSGRCTVEKGGRLDFGPIAATMMLCPDSELEGRYTRFLGRASHYELDGTMLVLSDNDGATAVFEARGPRKR